MPEHYDDRKIQKVIVSFIADRLGDDVWLSHQGSGIHTGKYKIFDEAKATFAPTIGINTIERWWEYFLWHGETKAEKLHRERMNGTKKRKPRRYKGEWESLHTVMLRKIIADHPEFYLDEIRERLYRMGGGWWATSTIWKKLMHDLDYS